MNLPSFSAERSLYRASGHYQTFGLAFADSPSSHSIVPAYFPNPESVAKCQGCIEGCLKALGACTAAAVFFPPALAVCVTTSWACIGYCSVPGTNCCPTVCSFDPFNQPGGGCCDWGEHCVHIDDRNARHGCCPSDQNVCGGRCCAKGERCCGGECCPENFHCIDGFCTLYPSFGKSEPSPREGKHPFDVPWLLCMDGRAPCHGECCSPSLVCCADGCKNTCVH